MASLKPASDKSAMSKFIVPKEDARVRLDRFLARELPEHSRSRIQQLVRIGFVRLNGATTRPRQLLRTGDKSEVTEPPPEKIETRPEPIPLDVLFEDNDLIVINKPAGLVVHPGAGHREHTLVNALLSHCPTLSGIGGKERPGIVHRLDKDTSGCLVVAKNDATHRELSRQFAERIIFSTMRSATCLDNFRCVASFFATISQSLVYFSGGWWMTSRSLTAMR